MKHILVVDDELDILETIVDTLEIEFDAGSVTIHQAINGVEALRMFKDNSILFDLVITDLNMPEMDGIELTEHIKKISPGMNVIVFTGHGDIEEMERLNLLGVSAMIKKPYVEELIDEVTNSIN